LAWPPVGLAPHGQIALLAGGTGVTPMLQASARVLAVGGHCAEHSASCSTDHRPWQCTMQRSAHSRGPCQALRLIKERAAGSAGGGKIGVGHLHAPRATAGPAQRGTSAHRFFGSVISPFSGWVWWRDAGVVKGRGSWEGTREL